MFLAYVRGTKKQMPFCRRHMTLPAMQIIKVAPLITVPHPVRKTKKLPGLSPDSFAPHAFVPKPIRSVFELAHLPDRFRHLRLMEPNEAEVGCADQRR